jgi:hypothetical protein
MDTIPSLDVKSAKTFSFKSLLVKFCLVVILIATMLIYWFYYNVYSDGERTGMLTKFSHKGNIFKTYEGDMMIGNISQTASGLANEKFFFSVEDKTIADNLMKLQGQRVSLMYKQYRRNIFWRGESEYIITGFVKISN